MQLIPELSRRRICLRQFEALTQASIFPSISPHRRRRWFIGTGSGVGTGGANTFGPVGAEAPARS